YFDRLWQPDEARATHLVFIGKGLDKSLITDALAAAQLELTA
ncbi:MAG: cobalamin biosynthesis protein CobW, partial [Oleiphilaceae bacterium]